MNGEDGFLLFGYQTLSLEAKETYRVMRNLGKLHAKRKKETTIDLTLEYLATVFNTTQEAQSARIQQLVKHKLIVTKRKAFRINTYSILEPVPDSTFVVAVIRLIKRKRLGQLAFKYAQTHSISEKVQYLQEIEKLHRKGTKHYKVSNIIGKGDS